MSSVRPVPKTPSGRCSSDPQAHQCFLDAKGQGCPGPIWQGLCPLGTAMEVLGSHCLDRWKVKVTSIIKEPVNVNGLLPLLALEDGARLLTGQGSGVHCWGKRVLVSAKCTTGHKLKASLPPGPSPAPHKCLKPPPCLQNNPQSWGCSGQSQARTNLPVPGAALLPVPFLGCSGASNVGLTEEGGEEQGQHSSASLSSCSLIPAQ